MTKLKPLPSLTLAFMLASSISASAKSKADFISDVAVQAPKTLCSTDSVLTRCYQMTAVQCTERARSAVPICANNLSSGFNADMTSSEETAAMKKMNACLSGVLAGEFSDFKTNAKGCTYSAPGSTGTTAMNTVNPEALTKSFCDTKGGYGTCFDLTSQQCAKSVAEIVQTCKARLARDKTKSIDQARELNLRLANCHFEEFDKLNESKFKKSPTCKMYKQVRDEAVAGTANLGASLCKEEAFRSCYKVTDAECVSGTTTFVQECAKQERASFPATGGDPSAANAWSQKVANCASAKFHSANLTKFNSANTNCK